MGDREQAVEIGAADVDATVGQDVSLAIGRRRALGRNADDGEVGGAAAHVDDQRQLLAADRALVVKRGRDRLELEVDVLEPLRAGGFFKLTLRVGVGLGVLVDELHGAAEHDVFDRLADMAFELVLEVTDEHADNVGEGDLLGLDTRLFMDEGRAEHAFQRAHQAALGAVGVFADGTAAHGGVVVLEIEEDGRRQGDALAFERDEARAAILDHADGGVGSAEVYAAVCRSHHVDPEFCCVGRRRSTDRAAAGTVRVHEQAANVDVRAHYFCKCDRWPNVATFTGNGFRGIGRPTNRQSGCSDDAYRISRL